jgi:hypothetical protein
MWKDGDTKQAEEGLAALNDSEPLHCRSNLTGSFSTGMPNVDCLRRHRDPKYF